MIVNGSFLLEAAPIRDMCINKVPAVPTSYGLTECGYDIRIKQEIHFYPWERPRIEMFTAGQGFTESFNGRCVLASSVEFFHMPTDLMGQVLNKSTWARQFVDASLTTNIEPGWEGNLTIELVFSGS